MPAKKPCTNCRLHLTRRTIVYGRGSIPADVLFLGDAPGRSEDLTGKAFIGLSGKLLDQILIDAGIKTTYYITNIVLCRPCDTSSGMNREPRSDEVLSCIPNILSIYNKVRPEKVIFLGNFSERYYKKEFPSAKKIMHPASLLRGGGKKSPYYNMNVKLLKEALA